MHHSPTRSQERNRPKQATGTSHPDGAPAAAPAAHLEQAAQYADLGQMPALHRFPGPVRPFALLATQCVRYVSFPFLNRQRAFNHAVLQHLGSLDVRLHCLHEGLQGLNETHGRTQQKPPAQPPAADQQAAPNTRPKFRPQTIDQAVWESVVTHNEYRLPAQFSPSDLVLDVGAHIGAFSWAVLRRNAGHAWAFEADSRNFRLAEHNLEEFGPRARVFNRAVWRSDRDDHFLMLETSQDPTNTAGGGCHSAKAGRAVECIAFDRVVDMALSLTGARRVRLLKLDCEGSEWAVLLTSKRIHLIDEMCGEYHELLNDYGPRTAVDGYPTFSRPVLSRYLEHAGFRVELQPLSADGRLGLFWARRPPKTAA